MAIDLTDDTNLFGDAIAAASEINRDELAVALYAALKDISLEGFVAMFTNRFEAVVDYANLCAGEKAGQRISLLFNPHRLDTGTRLFPVSLYQKFKKESFFGNLARVVLLNKKKGATKDLLYASVGMGIGATSYVQEFPPHVARDIALQNGMSKRCRVLDPCAGWGGRMLGFSAVVDSYTCCEPSARTAAGLRQILAFIQTYRPDFGAEILEAPFEDAELPAHAFDFAMTSPPYYDTEHYAPGEAANSMNRYASFTEWCDGFYAPLIHRTMRALKPGSVFIVNIGSRVYPLNDKLIQIAEGKYDVSRDKQRLSASNGLGKQGEGETFYEVKNPGLWIEPDALPIVVASPAPVSVAAGTPISVVLANPVAVVPGVDDLAAAALKTHGDVLDAGETVEILPAVAGASWLVTARNEPPQLVTTSAQSVAPTRQIDADDTFNPLDAFLSALGPEPATAHPAQSEDADTVVYENHTVSVDETPSVSAVSLALASASVAVVETPRVAPAPLELNGHQIIARLREHGHHVFSRTGKLLVTDASTLTDDDRALIAAHRDDLLIVAPTFPETEQQAKTSIIQFLGEAPRVAQPSDWKVEAPPQLDNIAEVEIDFETDGLDWYNRDIAIGWALRLPDGRTKYYPIRHRNCSDQIDPAVALRWFQTELKHKRITNANTRFEVHVARTMGADLVAQRCTFSDVMHYAALLDDHRKKFALNELAKDYLGREKEGMDLDPTRMADYEPWAVARRAEGDVQTVAELKAAMWPQLDAQDLQRVRALEDAIIPVVCEMEKNGSPLDVELLTRFNTESEAHYHRLLTEISNAAGFHFDDSDSAWTRLFECYKIPLAYNKKKDSNELSCRPTFKDAILSRIDHPVIQKARFAAQLDSLRSKTFKPYLENVDSRGLLRVEYHQLRIDDDHGKRGTVSGRFSAPYVQQVPNHDNHREVFGDAYYPREVFVPASGLFFAGDAAQIEYRIFASHAKNPKVLQAYRDDPRLSFHKLMWPKITAYRPDFSYTNMKSFNFMRIYGGGIVKTAVMMNMITEAEGDEIQKMKAQRTSPKLAQAREIEEIYARELPEANPLMKKAMHLAMSQCNSFCNRADAMHKEFKHRGYVKTILGRRSRFPSDYKIHKALNAIIQGSAADIMKTKLVELFAQRHTLGFTMRATVHDEVTGDVPDVEAAQKIEAVLNAQSLPTEVPILWQSGTGKNWAEAK